MSTFTAPADGNYVLQASVGLTFSGGGLVSAGVGSTTHCRWANNQNFTLGASISSSVTIVATGVPGLDTANIGLPGFASNVAASDTVQLQCQVNSLLAVNNRTAITATITALQVSALTGNP